MILVVLVFVTFDCELIFSRDCFLCESLEQDCGNKYTCMVMSYMPLLGPTVIRVPDKVYVNFSA